jgi:hypothetical protein
VTGRGISLTLGVGFGLGVASLGAGSAAASLLSALSAAAALAALAFFFEALTLEVLALRDRDIASGFWGVTLCWSLTCLLVQGDKRCARIFMLWCVQNPSDGPLIRVLLTGVVGRLDGGVGVARFPVLYPF